MEKQRSLETVLQEIAPEKLYAMELLSEVKTLSNEDFIELELLLSKFIQAERDRRFGKYVKPVPNFSNNY